MRLESIRLENIGGFRTAEFPLRERNVLVGENNSGKTSILQVLRWCLKDADRALLSSQRQLTSGEEDLLIPARPTANRAARRLFLRVRIDDGRVARRFCPPKCNSVELRIQFRKERAYTTLNKPTRGESAESDERALDLLDRLQGNSSAVYVPAARDSRTAIYGESLRLILSETMKHGFLQNGKKGRAAKLPKLVQDFASVSSAEGTAQATLAWDAVREWTVGLFEPEVSFDLGVSPESAVEWLTDQVVPRFSFSDIDSNRVPVESLGAGPQSVLSMALIVRALGDKPNRFLLLEEPESFLHPSAQGTLARRLLTTPGHNLLVTTHSPEVVAEASPSDICILSGHTVFAPKQASAEQEAKDRYLLSTKAARSLFARSVLLVEGPGEEAFFEALRRRLADELPADVVGGMQVVPVGGKTAFGPWLRLLRRYRDHQGSEAVGVLFAVDSADGIADARAALTGSAVTIPGDVDKALKAVSNTDLDRCTSREEYASLIRERTRGANDALTEGSLPLRLMPVDLEYAMLADLPTSRFAEISALCESASSTLGGLLSALGSKGGSNKPSDKAGAKAPYKRALLGETLSWLEIPSETREVVWAWAFNAARGPLDRPECLRPTAARSDN